MKSATASPAVLRRRLPANFGKRRGAKLLPTPRYFRASCVTVTGAVLFEADPFPSCPSWFSPQHFTRPPATTAQEAQNPAAIVPASVSRTNTGAAAQGVSKVVVGWGPAESP